MDGINKNIEGISVEITEDMTKAFEQLNESVKSMSYTFIKRFNKVVSKEVCRQIVAKFLDTAEKYTEATFITRWYWKRKVYKMLDALKGLSELVKGNHFEDKSEPASDDLDKLVISLEETIGTSPHSREVIKEYLQKAAEWQKDKMKEALQTEYEKGRFDMMEEMMKNIVLETKVIMDFDGDGIETPYEEWITLENTEIPYIPEELGLKEGDNVKIIIVKEEQK